MVMLNFRWSLTGQRNRQEPQEVKNAVLHMRKNNPRHQYRVGIYYTESRFEEKDSGQDPAD